jgi:proteic killer suppression protein
MIVSFDDAATEAFYHGTSTSKTRGLPREIEGAARRKLDAVNAATRVSDLRYPPGNHLERLGGKRSDTWAIRVNDQWRVTFVWTPAGPARVKVEDYH